MIVTFCGHSKSYIKEEEKLRILEILENEHADEITFYLGGYGAFDSTALECSKTYKKAHPNSKLVLITPYPHSKNLEYANDIFDEVVYPELEHVPPKFAILKRNEWMMKNANLVIAYVWHDYGGAYQALKAALRYQKRIINIADTKKRSL